MADDAAAGQPASRKIFTDRVPQEVRVASASVSVPDAGQEQEKILAVEEVPEDSVAAPQAEQQEVPEPTVAAEAEVSADQDPVAEPPQDETKLTGWSVQIASATTEEAARATWNKMKARNKALASKTPVIVRADLGAKGIFYRVRLVGFDSQSEAGRECSRLKSRGVKCYVSKAAS
jgi:cell division septation protein DedD